MFKDYVLTKKDFEAVEEGIKTAYSEDMKHVFPRGLGDLDLASYDFKFIYLWSRSDYEGLEKIKDSVCRFKIYRIPHNLSLVNDDYGRISLTTGGIKIGGTIFKNLPAAINIQCAPLTARTKLKIYRYNTPAEEVSYEESHYRAIIVHEFGHYYFDQNVQHPFPKQLLNLAESSVELSDIELTDLLNPPNLNFLSELFATLVELEVLKVFYPEFLEQAIEGMNFYVKKNLEVSPLERKILLVKDGHPYAKILAPYIFKSFPNWPETLLK